MGQLIYFFFPAGVANMAPVLIGDRLKFLAHPIDGGKTFRGQPIFGSHKTWRGLCVAVIAGEMMWLIEDALTLRVPMTSQWSAFSFERFPWWFGFLFGAGAIGGDLLKSFVKRRMGIASGAKWFPFDQIDFLCGAAFVTTFFVPLSFLVWIAIFTVGPLLHLGCNRLGFWLGIKDRPW